MKLTDYFVRFVALGACLLFDLYWPNALRKSSSLSPAQLWL